MQGIADREFERLGLKSDALLTTARRHEATLHRINVEPLSSVEAISAEYTSWFDHLFLLTFFYDYCLDRADEEQYPEAFFVSVNMYQEYWDYVLGEFGEAGLDLLSKNNALQVRYQMIEKQWDNPDEYHRAHPDYEGYYRKQILCLTHLELLGLKAETRELSDRAVSLYKRYWSLVLLVDDIMDVDRDIQSKTLTPMIAGYYAENGIMPQYGQAVSLRRKWLPEVDRLFPGFERAASDFGVFDYLDIVEEMRDRLRQTYALD